MLGRGRVCLGRALGVPSVSFGRLQPDSQERAAAQIDARLARAQIRLHARLLQFRAQRSQHRTPSFAHLAYLRLDRLPLGSYLAVVRLVCNALGSVHGSLFRARGNIVLVRRSRRFVMHAHQLRFGLIDLPQYLVKLPPLALVEGHIPKEWLPRRRA
jgi:hypothetical protein